MKSFKLILVLFISQISFGQLAQIDWVTFDEAVELNKTNPKMFFFDIYTDWCGWCTKMDKNTFQNPQVAAYMNEHYYCIKFNAEKEDDITWNGKTYKLLNKGQRGAYHEFCTYLNNGKRVSGYPTVSFLNSDLKVLAPISSYLDIPKFESIIKFLVNGVPKGISYEEYMKTFKSEFSS